jgi:hypothetical protein
MAKRAEEMRIYEAKYAAESAEAQTRYNAEMDAAMKQWAADMRTWEGGGEVGRRVIRRRTSADDKSGRTSGGGRAGTRGL